MNKKKKKKQERKIIRVLKFRCTKSQGWSKLIRSRSLYGGPRNLLTFVGIRFAVMQHIHAGSVTVSCFAKLLSLVLLCHCCHFVYYWQKVPYNISADQRWLRVDGEASSGIGDLLLQASILSLIRFIKCYPSHENKNLPFVLSNAETSPLIVSLSHSYSLMAGDAV